MIYTSLGPGFPPTGCKHGEGGEVDQRGKKNTLSIHITFLKMDQMLRETTLGFIKASLQVPLGHFSTHGLFWHFLKSLQTGHSEHTCSESLVCPGFLAIPLGSPHSKAHTLPSSNPFIFHFLSLWHIFPFSAPSPPNTVSLILSLRSVSASPGNCIPRALPTYFKELPSLCPSFTDKGYEHPEGWTQVIFINTRLPLSARCPSPLPTPAPSLSLTFKLPPPTSHLTSLDFGFLSPSLQENDSL